VARRHRLFSELRGDPFPIRVRELYCGGSLGHSTQRKNLAKYISVSRIPSSNIIIWESEMRWAEVIYDEKNEWEMIMIAKVQKDEELQYQRVLDQMSGPQSEAGLSAGSSLFGTAI